MDIAMRLLKEEEEEMIQVHPGEEDEISRNYRRSQFEPRMPVGPSFPRIKVNQYNRGTFKDTPYNEETGFTRSEPMNIAMRLLKNYNVEDVKRRLMDAGAFEDSIDH